MLPNTQHYFYSQSGNFDYSLSTSPDEIFIGKNVTKTLFLDTVTNASHSSRNWVNNRITESTNVQLEDIIAEHLKKENASSIILKIVKVRNTTLSIDLLFKKVITTKKGK